MTPSVHIVTNYTLVQQKLHDFIVFQHDPTEILRIITLRSYEQITGCFFFNLIVERLGTLQDFGLYRNVSKTG